MRLMAIITCAAGDNPRTLEVMKAFLTWRWCVINGRLRLTDCNITPPVFIGTQQRRFVKGDWQLPKADGDIAKPKAIV